MIVKLCLVLMYGNHLLSFYADYTHYRTSFCRGNECIKRYYYDESSIDQITAKNCVQCNQTVFDHLILPVNFEESRKTLLKFCSVFFTIESICYLAMAIAFRFHHRRLVKLCLAYLILGLFAFLLTGIAFENPLLKSHYLIFNYGNLFLLFRLCLIDRSLTALNEVGWRLRFCRQIKIELVNCLDRLRSKDNV